MKNETDLVAAKQRHLIVRHLSDQSAVDQQLTAARPVQAADQMQQRAFPRTALPHHRRERALGNLQRYTGKRGDPTLALLVNFANVGAANHEAAELTEQLDGRRTQSAGGLGLIFFQRGKIGADRRHQSVDVDAEINRS